MTPQDEHLDLCNLLKEWKLPHLFGHLRDKNISLEDLLFLNDDDINEIFQNLPIGEQAVFEYKLKVWKSEENHGPNLYSYCQTTDNPCAINSNGFSDIEIKSEDDTTDSETERETNIKPISIDNNKNNFGTNANLMNLVKNRNITIKKLIPETKPIQNLPMQNVNNSEMIYAPKDLLGVKQQINRTPANWNDQIVCNNNQGHSLITTHFIIKADGTNQIQTPALNYQGTNFFKIFKPDSTNGLTKVKSVEPNVKSAKNDNGDKKEQEQQINTRKIETDSETIIQFNTNPPNTMKTQKITTILPGNIISNQEDSNNLINKNPQNSIKTQTKFPIRDTITNQEDSNKKINTIPKIPITTQTTIIPSNPQIPITTQTTNIPPRRDTITYQNDSNKMLNINPQIQTITALPAITIQDDFNKILNTNPQVPIITQTITTLPTKEGITNQDDFNKILNTNPQVPVIIQSITTFPAGEAIMNLDDLNKTLNTNPQVPITTQTITTLPTRDTTTNQDNSYKILNKNPQNSIKTHAKLSRSDTITNQDHSNKILNKNLQNPIKTQTKTALSTRYVIKNQDDSNKVTQKDKNNTMKREYQNKKRKIQTGSEKKTENFNLNTIQTPLTQNSTKIETDSVKKTENYNLNTIQTPVNQSPTKIQTDSGKNFVNFNLNTIQTAENQNFTKIPTDSENKTVNFNLNTIQAPSNQNPAKIQTNFENKSMNFNLNTTQTPSNQNHTKIQTDFENKSLNFNLNTIQASANHTPSKIDTDFEKKPVNFNLNTIPIPENQNSSKIETESENKTVNFNLNAIQNPSNQTPIKTQTAWIMPPRRHTITNQNDFNKTDRTPIPQQESLLKQKHVCELQKTNFNETNPNPLLPTISKPPLKNNSDKTKLPTQESLLKNKNFNDVMRSNVTENKSRSILSKNPEPLPTNISIPTQESLLKSLNSSDIQKTITTESKSTSIWSKTRKPLPIPTQESLLKALNFGEIQKTNTSETYKPPILTQESLLKALNLGEVQKFNIAEGNNRSILSRITEPLAMNHMDKPPIPTQESLLKTSTPIQESLLKTLNSNELPKTNISESNSKSVWSNNPEPLPMNNLDSTPMPAQVSLLKALNLCQVQKTNRSVLSTYRKPPRTNNLAVQNAQVNAVTAINPSTIPVRDVPKQESLLKDNSFKTSDNLVDNNIFETAQVSAVTKINIPASNPLKRKRSKITSPPRKSNRIKCKDKNKVWPVFQDDDSTHAKFVRFDIPPLLTMCEYSTEWKAVCKFYAVHQQLQEYHRSLIVHVIGKYLQDNNYNSSVGTCKKLIKQVCKIFPTEQMNKLVVMLQKKIISLKKIEAEARKAAQAIKIKNMKIKKKDIKKSRELRKKVKTISAEVEKTSTDVNTCSTEIEKNATDVNTSCTDINTSCTDVNALFTHKNTSLTNANTSLTHENTSCTGGNTPLTDVNPSLTHVNTSFTHVNTSCTDVNTSFTHVNTSCIDSNTSFTHVNTSCIDSNTSFTHINTSCTDVNTPSTETQKTDVKKASAPVQKRNKKASKLNTIDSLRNNPITSDEFEVYWKLSWDDRRVIINQADSIAKIFKIWPEYKKSLGYQLISTDFSQMFPDAKDLEVKWAQNRTRLLQLFQIHAINNANITTFLLKYNECNEDSKIFATFWFLHYIFAPTKSYVLNEGQKYTFTESQETFALIANNSLELGEKTKLFNQRSSIRPCILVLGDVFDVKGICLYFNGITYPIIKTLLAVDILYKIFFVFNLEFPKESERFYQFIQTFFYEMKL